MIIYTTNFLVALNTNIVILIYYSICVNIYLITFIFLDSTFLFIYIVSILNLLYFYLNHSKTSILLGFGFNFYFIINYCKLNLNSKLTVFQVKYLKNV